MNMRTGLVVDCFGVFQNLEKALNFDENLREESLIDCEALKATVPGEVMRCMELVKGIQVADTRECLLSALRRLNDPDAAKNFEHNFKSLERLWEAVAPDPCLYEHRYTYNWLCSIYIAHRRRQRGSQSTYGELSAETRKLIEENTGFIRIAEALPVYKIDKDYITYLADSARRMAGHLRANQLLTPGWNNSRGGRMRVAQSLLAESWNPAYAQLGFDPDDAAPPFLKPAVEELAKMDS
jgi:type I restriction enzyme R subunit